MVNVESSEFDSESLDDEYGDEEVGPTGSGYPATVYINIKFKSGHDKSIVFDVPTEVPVYVDQLTSYNIFDIMTTTLTFGEAPILALPNEGSLVFVDMAAVDYTEVRIVKHGGTS